MNKLIVFFILFVLKSCIVKESKKQIQQHRLVSPQDTLINKKTVAELNEKSFNNYFNNPNYSEYQNCYKYVNNDLILASVVKMIFTNELHQKYGNKDTLIDLNSDGYVDYLNEYYGESGSGEKNRIEVFLYNSKKHDFLRDSLLCCLYNPLFDFKNNRITELYITSESGYYAEYKWVKKKLEKLIEINTEIQMNDTIFYYNVEEINYKSGEKKKYTLKHLPQKITNYKYKNIVKR